MWRQEARVNGNGQLFLFGYSEGGYATLAAQRAMEADPLGPHRATLAGSVAGAGPDDVQTTLDGLLQRVREQSHVLASLGSTPRNEVRRLILRLAIPEDADVSFQSDFVDNFLAGDDKTVPYASSEQTLNTMQVRSSRSVQPFWTYMTEQTGLFVRDLRDGTQQELFSFFLPYRSQ